MGDLLPFRKRRKTWTRPEDYGRVLPTKTWRGEPRRLRNGRRSPIAATLARRRRDG